MRSFALVAACLAFIAVISALPLVERASVETSDKGHSKEKFLGGGLLPTLVDASVISRYPAYRGAVNLNVLNGLGLGGIGLGGFGAGGLGAGGLGAGGIGAGGIGPVVPC